jgi:hypothetical protein
MIGIDADYAVSRAYNAQGWPAWIVIDQTGVVRFQGFDSDRELSGVRGCLNGLLAEQPPGPDTGQTMEQGIALPQEVLDCCQAHRERSPRLALDAKGQPYVVYYTGGKGTNAVFLRRFNPQGQPAGEERLSPENADAYAADCTFDSPGTLWVTWCGWNERFYDIFVLSRREGQAPVIEKLTDSDDDAMSPKIAVGPNGSATVVYYKWAKMRGISRDRNIFERTFDPAQRKWSEELEVSPHEPEVEDHSDPDVAIDRVGAAWVVWSYDYHPQLFKRPVDAAEPTIFAARVGSNLVSAAFVVGSTGQYRHAIDLFPSLAIDGQGAMWCAWDASEPSRCIRVARLGQSSSDEASGSTFGSREVMCSTPELSPAKGNQLLLAWSQRSRTGSWQGKAAVLEGGRALKTITLTETADVLFPQCQQGTDGRVWVTYEKSRPEGSQVVLRDITRDLGFQAEPQAKAEAR